MEGVWLQTKSGSFISLEHVTHITVAVGESTVATLHFVGGSSTTITFPSVGALVSLQQQLTSALSNKSGELIDISPFEL